MTSLRTLSRFARYLPGLFAALTLSHPGQPLAATHTGDTQIVAAGKGDADTAETTKNTGHQHTSIIVKGIEPVTIEHSSSKDLPWLGVSVEEASEVVTAQLDLDSGAGLVVTYVATNSPAAKVELQKNDVLVEFDSQLLVHPAQLRKLVQARKEGDRVKLVFYRAGKKQSVTATLAKTTPGFGLLDGEHFWGGDWRELQRQLRNLPIGDALRKEMEVVRKSLGDVHIDQKQVQEEIRRSMTEARKAWQEAMKQITNASSSLGPAARALRDLQKRGFDLDKKTTVTVRNAGNAVKSIVKTDDAGTLVIVSNPKPRLTAHDKDGKLLFDGEIETDEQRAKVPPEVWERAEPLLKKLDRDGKEPNELEAEDEAAASENVPSAELEALILDSPVAGRMRLQ